MLYPSYKSNRIPTPDTVVQGLQYLKASMKAMSLKVIEVGTMVDILSDNCHKFALSGFIAGSWC